MRRLLFLLLVGAVASLQAQEGQSWIAVHAGETLFGSRDHLKDEFHYGLGLGHWYSDRWGLDLRGLRNELQADAPGAPSGKEAHLLLSGLLNLRPGAETWYPYLTAGLGGTVVGSVYSPSRNRTTRLNYHGGLGLMGNLSEHTWLDLNARAVRIELPTSRTEYLATLGLGYTWGGGWRTVPAPAPAPAPEPAPAPSATPVPMAPPPPPAPEPPREAPKPELPAPPPPAKIVLDEALLHFANGRADVDANGAAAIRKVALSLRAYPGDYSLVITGYTSSVGSRSFNKALSKRRADAVAQVLAEAGIARERMLTVGAGPEHPVADNATREGQARNRRVEIEVKVKDGNAEVRKTVTDVVEAPAPRKEP